MADASDDRAWLSQASARLDRWWRVDVLPLWATAGWDADRGGFYDALGFDGRPQEPRRARVQARQAWVYATAAPLAPDGGWDRLAWAAMDGVFAAHRRDDGLFRTSTDAAGKALDDGATLYDQAFVLLALSALAAAGPRRDEATERADDLLRRLDDLRHPAGGFREAEPHPFQANAHMHLFETALAWVEADGGGRWSTLADEIGRLALGCFIDPEGGFVREFFDADWRPAPGEDGRLVEPGHQFEWAWLLDRWTRLGGPAEAQAAARRLYAVGGCGVDPVSGSTLNALTPDLTASDAGVRLWPQTEHVKAALAFGDAGDARRATTGLMRHLEGAPRGLWRERFTAEGRWIEQAAPASSLYHLAGAVAALKAAFPPA